MSLYHFSDEPGIEVFVPRPPIARPEVEPLVWAVDAEHAWTYLFPRDCPRVLLWKTSQTNDTDWRRWAGANETERVAAVEWHWFERLKSQRLYRYRFEADLFRPMDDDPWMYVSRDAVRPDGMEVIGDLVKSLAESGVELRFMPSLRPFRGAWQSTVHFSGIRLRNAVGWE